MPRMQPLSQLILKPGILKSWITLSLKTAAFW